MKKKFILVVTAIDEECRFNSKNEGFNALEVLGILSSKIEDIKDQMKGLINPTIFERKLVEEKK
jgi:hypothetical protein